MSVWVWPPQISMRTQGRVTVAAISATRARATLGSRYSSMNFMRGILLRGWEQDYGDQRQFRSKRLQPDQNCVVRAATEPGLHYRISDRQYTAVRLERPAPEIGRASCRERV